MAASSRPARWSTAAIAPAISSNAGVPVSNRSGTESGEGTSLSGLSRSSTAGADTVAETCGPPHLYALVA